MEAYDWDDLVQTFSDSQSFLEIFPELLRGTALLFWKSVVEKNEDYKINDSSSREDLLQAIHDPPTISNNPLVLMLSRRAVDKRFEKFEAVSGSPDRITFGLILEALKYPLEPIKSTTILDLSSNYLSDDTMSDVLEVVKLLPSLEIVDLSRNSLTINSWLHLEQLLRMPNLKYVSIVSNEFLASSDSKDFFAQLKAEYLLKLIWLPQPWLNGRGWIRNLGPHVGLMISVEKYHRTFYAIRNVKFQEWMFSLTPLYFLERQIEYNLESPPVPELKDIISYVDSSKDNIFQNLIDLMKSSLKYLITDESKSLSNQNPVLSMRFPKKAPLSNFNLEKVSQLFCNEFQESSRIVMLNCNNFDENQQNQFLKNIKSSKVQCVFLFGNRQNEVQK